MEAYKSCRSGGASMEYMTVSEAVEKCDIVRHAITYHPVEGHIPGAVKREVCG